MYQYNSTNYSVFNSPSESESLKASQNSYENEDNNMNTNKYNVEHRRGWRTSLPRSYVEHPNTTKWKEFNAAISARQKSSKVLA